MIYSYMYQILFGEIGPGVLCSFFGDVINADVMMTWYLDWKLFFFPERFTFQTNLIKEKSLRNTVFKHHANQSTEQE